MKGGQCEVVLEVPFLKKVLKEGIPLFLQPLQAREAVYNQELHLVFGRAIASSRGKTTANSYPLEGQGPLFFDVSGRGRSRSRGEELRSLLHLLLHEETKHHLTSFVAREPLQRLSGRSGEGRRALCFDHLAIGNIYRWISPARLKPSVFNAHDYLRWHYATEGPIRRPHPELDNLCFGRYTTHRAKDGDKEIVPEVDFLKTIDRERVPLLGKGSQAGETIYDQEPWFASGRYIASPLKTFIAKAHLLKG